MNRLWAILLLRLIRNPDLTRFTFLFEAVYHLNYEYLSRSYNKPSPHFLYIWSHQTCCNCGTIQRHYNAYPIVPVCGSCFNKGLPKVNQVAADQLNFALSQLTDTDKAFFDRYLETALEIS